MKPGGVGDTVVRTTLDGNVRNVWYAYLNATAP